MSNSMAAQLFELIQACSLCTANISRGDIRLCPVCEKYVGQDHVAQRELQLSSRTIQAILPHPESNQKRNVERFEAVDTFELLLEEARLSPRQKEVMRMRFVENLNFFSIAKNLGISNGCTFVYYKRGLKRLKKCMTNLRLVRGQESETASELKKGSSQAHVSIKETKLYPVRLLRPDASGVLQLVRIIEASKLVLTSQPQDRRNYSRDHYPRNCPRCSGVLLQPRGQAPYCADCLWVPELHE